MSRSSSRATGVPAAARPASIAAAAFFVVVTIAMTWPLARDIRTGVPDHDDAYFGIWRMAWVAHQLPRAPLRLFDANIFVPAPNTFALSDAALLQGLIAAPALWLGARPLVVYNVLLLASLALSAWCAYVLALRLTGRVAPSLVAGVVFGFAPHRLAQFGHLEMQSAMWMPLALLALHTLVGSGPTRATAWRADGPPQAQAQPPVPARRAGAALGLVLALQALSGLYYFMFLALVLAVMVAVLMIAIRWPAQRRLVRGLVAAALVVAAVVVPYSRPYAKARALVGPRGADEVGQFSGRPGDYLEGGAFRWLPAARDGRPVGEEHVLSPGLVAPVLAVAGLWPPLDAWRAAMGVALVVAVDASLGTNGVLFPAARRSVPALDGLRVPARFAVLVLLLVAVLGAIGLVRLTRRRGPGALQAASGVALLACAAEFFVAPMTLRYPMTAPTPLTRFLASRPAGTVVLHLPVPRTSDLWLHETTYQYLSTFHWQPLVNGYSGFPPPIYLRTLDVLRRFPDGESVARLRRLGVGYVVLHPEQMGEADYARVASQLERSDDFAYVARFGPPPMTSVVFQLTPEGAHDDPSSHD
jgi:hypothetical protein